MPQTGALAQSFGPEDVFREILRGAVAADRESGEPQSYRAPANGRDVVEDDTQAEEQDKEVPQPSIDPRSSRFSVAGISLGTPARALGLNETYSCTPSEQYPGFTWCRKKEQKKEKKDKVEIATSVLQNQNGEVYYANRQVNPARFRREEAKSEIGRLSKRFGEAARVIELPKRPGWPSGLIALWGDVRLKSIDQASITALAAGNATGLGIMMDYLGSFKLSAQKGLPIYAVAGGPGFVWAVNYDSSGRGTLRFSAVDMSRVDGANILYGGFANQEELEAAQAAGFQSRSEMLTARSNGFPTKEDADRATAGGFGSKAEMDAAQQNGFPSAAEAKEAHRKGFATKRDFEAAEQAGFDTAAEYQKAREGGFGSRAEWDAAKAAGFANSDDLRRAQSAGYRTNAEYRAGHKAGFASKSEQDTAAREGFGTAAEYEAFQNSGFSSGEDFRIARDQGFQSKAQFDAAEAKRREAARTDADLIIADVDAFLRAKPDAPQLLQIAEGVTALRNALNSSSREIEARREELANVMRSVPGFGDFAAQKTAERRDAELAALASAKAESLRQRTFVQSWIAKNVTHPAVQDLLKLVGASETASGSGDRGQIERNVAAVKAVFSRFDLDRDYSLGMAALSPEASPDEKARQEGYADAAEKDRIRSAGFGTKPEYDTARAAGFDTRQALEDARKAGFATAHEYAAARNAGFDTKAEQDTALRESLTSKRDFAAFLKSGFRSGAEFLKARERGYDTKAGADAADATRRAEATKASETLLSDVDSFLKLKPDIPEILEVAGAVAKLRAALADPSSDVEGSRVALNAVLGQVQGFADFGAAREGERRETEQAALTQAKEIGRRQLAFARSWVAKNINDGAVQQILPLLGDLGGALGGSDRGRIEKTEKSVTAFFVERNLEGVYSAGMDALKPREPDKENSAQLADKDRAVSETDRNRFLIAGDPGDIVAAYNAAGAPHVTKTIRGDLVFDADTATACYFPSRPPEPDRERFVVKRIREMGAKHMAPLQVCSREELPRVDLILVSRGAFLKGKPSELAALLARVEQGASREAFTLRSGELKGEVDQERLLVSQVDTDVRHGGRLGFGLLAIHNDGSALCAVVDRDEAGHRKVLDSLSDRISDYRVTLSGLSILSRDAAFSALQRSQCRAVYASASDLKAMLEALDRDHIRYDILPLWVEQTSVETAQNEIAAEAERAAREAGDRERRATEEQALAAQRAKDEAARREVRERDLHEQNGAQARALQNRLEEYIRQIQAGNREVIGFFPDFAEWYHQKETDHWEDPRFATEVADYGKADWDGRKLDAGAVLLTIRMKNSVAGRYSTDCFLLGFIDDAEFAMARAPLDESCTPALPELSQWEQANGFESKWRAR